jgi:hypothetical protein
VSPSILTVSIPQFSSNPSHLNGLRISNRPGQALLINSSHTSLRDSIFKQGMHSSIEFQTNILHFAAMHRAWIQGLQMTHESAAVRTKTIAMLNNAAQYPKKHNNDKNIMAVTALAAQEALFPFLHLAPQTNH